MLRCSLMTSFLAPCGGWLRCAGGDGHDEPLAHPGRTPRMTPAAATPRIHRPCPAGATLPARSRGVARGWAAGRSLGPLRVRAAWPGTAAVHRVVALCGVALLAGC